MLILSRRVGERLTIGPDVTLTVVSVKGGQIRLGIDAPKGVAIHREEVLDKLKEQELDDDKKAD